MQDSNIGHHDHANEGRGVGALLRASRLRCGEELRDVATLLRIRLVYLEAIEDNRYADLPGQTYAVGFVRTYADHLGLDAEEVVRRFKEETEGKEGGTKLVFPVPVHESGIPGGAILFVGLIVAGLAYGGWYLSSSNQDFFQNLISPVPEHLAEATGETKQDQAAKIEEVTEPPVMEDEKPVERTVQEKTEKAVETTEQETEKTVEAVKEIEEVKEIDEQVGQKLDAATGQGEEAATPVEEQAPAITEPSEPASEPASTENAMKDAAVEPSTEPATEAPAEPREQMAEEATEKAPVEETAPAAPSVEASATPVETVVEATPVETVSEPVAEATAASSTESSTEPEPALKAEPAPVVEAAPEPTPTPAPEPAPKEEVASAPAKVDADRVYGDKSGDVRIVIQATQNTFIQVRDEETQKLLMTRMLRAGDSYRVPNKSGIRFSTGNAGALEIKVDGEAVKPLGENGKVVRDVALDADQLKSGHATGQ